MLIHTKQLFLFLLFQFSQEIAATYLGMNEPTEVVEVVEESVNKAGAEMKIPGNVVRIDRSNEEVRAEMEGMEFKNMEEDVDEEKQSQEQFSKVCLVEMSCNDETPCMDDKKKPLK